MKFNIFQKLIPLFLGIGYITLNISLAHSDIGSNIIIYGNQSYEGELGDGGPAANAHFNPLGLTVDDTGNIYIADAAHNRIRKIDTHGIITTIIGSGIEGSNWKNLKPQDIELSRPTGIALDNAGNFYIADYGNSRVVKVSSQGAVNLIGGPNRENGLMLESPRNVGVNRDNVFYIGEDGQRSQARHDPKIFQITPDNKIMKIFQRHNIDAEDAPPEGDSNPIRNISPDSVIVGNDGNIYLLTIGSIWKRDGDGIFTCIVGNPKGLNCGFSGDGKAAKNAQIYKPEGIAVDKKGTLYFADSFNNRIRLVDLSGKIFTLGADETGKISDPQIEKLAPSNLTLDKRGNLYVTSGNRIIKFPMDWLDRVSTPMLLSNEPVDPDLPKWATGFDYQTGTVFSTQANLYIAMTTNSVLIRTVYGLEKMKFAQPIALSPLPMGFSDDYIGPILGQSDSFDQEGWYKIKTSSFSFGWILAKDFIPYDLNQATPTNLNNKLIITELPARKDIFAICLFGREAPIPPDVNAYVWITNKNLTKRLLLIEDSFINQDPLGQPDLSYSPNGKWVIVYSNDVYNLDTFEKSTFNPLNQYRAILPIFITSDTIAFYNIHESSASVCLIDMNGDNFKTLFYWESGFPVDQDSNGYPLSISRKNNQLTFSIHEKYQNSVRVSDITVDLNGHLVRRNLSPGLFEDFSREKYLKKLRRDIKDLEDNLNTNKLRKILFGEERNGIYYYSGADPDVIDLCFKIAEKSTDQRNRYDGIRCLEDKVNDLRYDPERSRRIQQLFVPILSKNDYVAKTIAGQVLLDLGGQNGEFAYKFFKGLILRQNTEFKNLPKFKQKWIFTQIAKAIFSYKRDPFSSTISKELIQKEELVNYCRLAINNDNASMFEGVTWENKYEMDQDLILLKKIMSE